MFSISIFFELGTKKIVKEPLMGCIEIVNRSMNYEINIVARVKSGFIISNTFETTDAVLITMYLKISVPIYLFLGFMMERETIPIIEVGLYNLQNNTSSILESAGRPRSAGSSGSGISPWATTEDNMYRTPSPLTTPQIRYIDQPTQQQQRIRPGEDILSSLENDIEGYDNELELEMAFEQLVQVRPAYFISKIPNTTIFSDFLKQSSCEISKPSLLS